MRWNPVWLDIPPTSPSQLLPYRQSHGPLAQNFWHFSHLLPQPSEQDLPEFSYISTIPHQQHFARPRTSRLLDHNLVDFQPHRAPIVVWAFHLKICIVSRVEGNQLGNCWRMCQFHSSYIGYTTIKDAVGHVIICITTHF